MGGMGGYCMQMGHFLCVVVLGLAACGGGQKKAPEPAFHTQAINPLEACRTTTMSRVSRGAECPGANVLFVSRESSADELLRGTQAQLVAYQYAPSERVLKVNGRDQPVLEYQMGEGETPALHVLFTAFSRPYSTESIEAQCYAEHGLVEPRRCAVLLDGFIAQGLLRGEWPRTLSASQPQESIDFHVGGHTARLPSNCYRIGPLDLDCKDGHLRLFVNDAADKLSRMEQVDLKATRDDSLIRERTVPCTLEGVATTCTFRRFRLPYSDELWSFHASAVVRDVPILLSCEVKKSRANPPPGPICTQFFAFEQGALEEPQSLTREEE
jgi:hypothetical protein